MSSKEILGGFEIRPVIKCMFTKQSVLATSSLMIKLDHGAGCDKQKVVYFTVVRGTVFCYCLVAT